MSKNIVVASQGERVEFRLPGLVVNVWVGVLEESDLLNIMATDAIVVQPVAANRIIIRKRK